VGVGDSAKLPMEKMMAWSTYKQAWNINNWQDFKRMMMELQDEDSTRTEFLFLLLMSIQFRVKLGLLYGCYIKRRCDTDESNFKGQIDYYFT